MTDKSFATSNEATMSADKSLTERLRLAAQGYPNNAGALMVEAAEAIEAANSDADELWQNAMTQSVGYGGNFDACTISKQAFKDALALAVMAHAARRHVRTAGRDRLIPSAVEATCEHDWSRPKGFSTQKCSKCGVITPLSSIAAFGPIDGNPANTALENWFPFSAEELHRLQQAATLPADILAVCKARGWNLHWTHRGAYLHLEASELIEALRGKRGEPLHEAADVLLVLMSITQNAGIPWSEVLAKARAICEEKRTQPHYPGEEYEPKPVSAIERLSEQQLREIRGALEYKWPAKRGQSDSVMNYELWRAADDAIDNAKTVIDKALHALPPTTTTCTGLHELLTKVRHAADFGYHGGSKTVPGCKDCEIANELDAEIARTDRTTTQK